MTQWNAWTNMRAEHDATRIVIIQSTITIIATLIGCTFWIRKRK